ncbi:MAG: hypothetical protein VR72_21065 [Clostridiaceae bacterium BRH_c20a]|nr:MAG: hypothetical protein VR72_21065 [Clostridiaceae bacterium BRH_c20a]
MNVNYVQYDVDSAKTIAEKLYNLNYTGSNIRFSYNLWGECSDYNAIHEGVDFQCTNNYSQPVYAHTAGEITKIDRTNKILNIISKVIYHVIFLIILY